VALASTSTPGDRVQERKGTELMAGKEQRAKFPRNRGKLPMTTEHLRIERIRIHGLFRQYDHDIPLRLDERVTILHGRNGVGKTIVLSLIDALKKGITTKLLGYLLP
jgi:hypothetical protein